MKVVNLTPHKIKLRITNGNYVDIDPAGLILRVGETIEEKGEITTELGNIKLIKKQLTEIPEEQIRELKEIILNNDGKVVFIVSYLAGLALKNDNRLSEAEKATIYIIGETERDSEGRIFAAKSLVNILDI